MSFAKGSRLLTHLIALASFSAFFFNDYFHLGWAFFGIAAIAVSFLLTCAGRRLSLSLRFWNGLSLFFCLFLIIDFLWFSRALLPASMHFLVYLMAYRLFHLEKSRDDLQLYLICLLQLLAAAGGGNHFGYAVSFSLSCLFLVWGLLVQHFKAEREERAPLLLEKRFREVIPFSFFIITDLLAIGSLFLTLLVFFLIPRIGIGLFSNKESPPQKISGFSERVDFGSMGPIKLDPSLVMRVIPSDAVPRGFYLRGMSFDLYDGLAWKNTLMRKTDLPQAGAPRNGGAGERGFEIAPLHGQTAFKEMIFLEPLDTAVLFISESVSILRGGFQTLSKDSAGAFYLPSIPTGRIEYEMIAAPRRLSPSDGRATRVDYPIPIRNHYLSIEASPRVVALSEEITRPASTIYQKAEAVERYLKTRYTYSLEVAPSSRPPIDDFLFYQKKGYCEYYATAMVALLRSVGIASRLVTGFLPGEWNAFGRYYLVRQSDAHAWVEVYFPEGGWFPFDPTPTVAQDSNPLFKTVAAYVDWMRLKWDRYIVRYSLFDQFTLFQGTRDQVGLLLNRFAGMIAKGARIIRWISPRFVGSIGAILFLFGIGVLLYKKERSRKERQAARRKEAAAFYHRMLRLLAKRGFVKEESQTALEFIERVKRSAGKPLGPVEGLTELYCQIRFGARPFSTEEGTRVERLLREIETTF